MIAIYSFCCRNFRQGDRIYCFGFSRGAFTIRIVAAMIASEGLVAYDDNEADLARFAADAYRRYRRRFTGGILKYLCKVRIDLRGIRDFMIRLSRRLQGQNVNAPPAVEVESIQFVGIWDTVDAYGGPIEEMTRAIDYWVWPLSMPDQFMSAKILKACHAMSLEDERAAFTPVIWDERYVRAKARVPGNDKTDWLFDINHDPRCEAAKQAEPPPHQRTQLPEIDQKRISQVWFVGVHADVGGGYPQNGLAYVTLDWMLDRAEPYGLRYFAGQRSNVTDPRVWPDDKLNNSRKDLPLTIATSRAISRIFTKLRPTSRRSATISPAYGNSCAKPIRHRHEFSTTCIRRASRTRFFRQRSRRFTIAFSGAFDLAPIVTCQWSCRKLNATATPTRPA